MHKFFAPAQITANAQAISTFLAAHEDELGINDYQRMLEWEIAYKKRSTVVKALKQLIGA
jgi:hypothetical protein